MSLSRSILSFLLQLKFKVPLPRGFEVLDPFSDDETRKVCETFYYKFYDDNNPRYCIIGINPGRFGAGVTGIPFTDPIRLEKELGITNNWAKKQELSSLYMYDMMHAFGGVDKFYSQFYITAVSPLGFIKDGKNVNYYDDKILMQSIKPFVIDCFEKQLTWGLNRSVAFCLGEGTNYKYLSKLNDEVHLFDEIIPLSHPRFIMQYKLKKKEEYIDKYLTAFERCVL